MYPLPSFARVLNIHSQSLYYVAGIVSQGPVVGHIVQKHNIIFSYRLFLNGASQFMTSRWKAPPLLTMTNGGLRPACSGFDQSLIMLVELALLDTHHNQVQGQIDVEDTYTDPVAIYMSKVKDKVEEEKIYYETIYFQERSHEEKELFITEAINLRRLFVARKEFIIPIKELMTSAEFSETYKHLLDFIDFQGKKFIALDPKR